VAVEWRHGEECICSGVASRLTNELVRIHVYERVAGECRGSDREGGRLQRVSVITQRIGLQAQRLLRGRGRKHDLARDTDKMDISPSRKQRRNDHADSIPFDFKVKC
jgi:hypothetical protein